MLLTKIKSCVQYCKENLLQEWQLWLFMSVFLGLLPFWWAVVTDLLNSRSIGWNKHFEDGVFLFFCSAMTISVAYDKLHEIMYTNKWRDINSKSGCITMGAYFAFPIVLFFLVLAAYSNLQNSTASVNAAGKSLQILCFCLTIAYSGCCKAMNPT